MAGWQQRISAAQRDTLFLAYRAAWWAAFVAVLALTLVIAPRAEIATQAKVRGFMTIGFFAFTNPSGQGQLGGAFGAAGTRAGFRNGDLLLAINGRPLSMDTAGRVAALALPEGSRVAVTAQRTGGQVYTTHVVHSGRYERDAYAGWHISFAGRRWAAFAVDLIANLALLSAALLLFLRRPRDPVAAILTLALLTVPLGSQNISTIIPGLDGETAATISNFFPTLAILLFPDGRLTTRWHWLALALAVAALPFNFVPGLVFRHFNYFNLLGYGGSLAIIAAVWSQFRLTPSGALRQQIKFVLLGVIIAIVLGIISQVLITVELRPMPEGERAWLILIKWTIISLGDLAIPAGLLVSLTRYRLYDADSVISRSVVFATLTLALLAIFAGSEKMIEILGEHYFGGGLGALASGLGAGFAALMMVPLHHRITHWAEHRFQGDLVHLRHGLPVLAGDMGATATPARLAAALLARIERGVRARYGAVVVGRDVLDARDIAEADVQAWLSAWPAPTGDHGLLDIDRADTGFPMRVPLYSDSVGLVGWLLLGPRRDGSFYGKDERETLAAIADPVARALAIALQRSERDTAHAREIGGIMARLGAIEAWQTDLAPRAA